MDYHDIHSQNSTQFGKNRDLFGNVSLDDTLKTIVYKLVTLLSCFSVGFVFVCLFVFFKTFVLGCVGGRPMMLAGGTLLVSTVWGELASMESPVSEDDGE